MPTKRIAEIRSLSLTVMQNFRNGNVSLILPFLHPDVTLVHGEDSGFLSGKQAVSDALAACQYPPPLLGEFICCQTAYVLPGSSNTCVVLCSRNECGHYCQSTTLIWETNDRSHRIAHIHASLQSPEAPLRLNGMTRERYYLQPSHIQYVEADNIYCYVSCGSQAFHVNHPLAMIEELLPDYFLRIHRSFLVNLYAVHALRPYCLELADGVQLPVPERKYLWLEDYLECWR